MAQIGYTLYCKLVKEQVRAAMGDAPAAQTESNVELGVNAYIPGSYIPEEEQKLDMYRRIEAIQTMDDARPSGTSSMTASARRRTRWKTCWGRRWCGPMPPGRILPA